MYEYEVYETIREVEAELELESMTGPQFPSIPGGGAKTPRKGNLKSVPGTKRPDVQSRIKQLAGVMRKALAGDEDARFRFCGWYKQFSAEYPQIEPAFRKAVAKLCPGL